MVKKGVFLILIVFFSFSFVGSVDSPFGYNNLEPTPCIGNQVRTANGNCVVVGEIFSNDTGFVNSSNFWVTNVGSLGNVNTTQFNNNGGFLNIIQTWIESLNINIFDQNLNTTDNVVFNTVNISGFNSGDVLNNEFDLQIGTNGHGAIRLGSSEIFDTNMTISDMDFNGSLVFRNVEASSNFQFVFVTTDNVINFLIPQPGVDYATYNPRSFMIGGDLGNTFNNSLVNCTTQGYDNIDCNTGLTGADLGIQDDLEVRGTIFAKENLIITDRIFLDESRELWISSNASEIYSGEELSEETIWLHHNETHDEGTIGFLLTMTNRTMLWAQVGMNNSAGGLGNSQMIIPNNLSLGFLNADGRVNMTSLSNCFTVINALGQTARIACDTDDTGADFFVHDDIQLGGKLFTTDGIRSEGDVDYFMRGFDFDVFNGSLHVRTPRLETIGREVGDNTTFFDNDFNDGTLQNFVQITSTSVATREWTVVSSVNCLDDECPRAQGGNSATERIMEANISTMNFNLMVLNFTTSTVGIEAPDLLNVTVNNNVGSGDVQVFSINSVTAIQDVSVSLPSSMDNRSVVSLRYIFSATNQNEEAYADEITITGFSNASTTLTLIRLDTEILLGDGSQRMFWNDTTKTLELPANVTFVNVEEVNLTVTDSITLDGITINNWNQTAINIFDQVVNISSNPQFANITSTGNLTVTGNSSFIGGVVLNKDASADSDIRIKSAFDDAAFFFESSTGRIGFGTDNPESFFNVKKDLPGSTLEYIIENNDTTNLGSKSALRLITDVNGGDTFVSFEATGEGTNWFVGRDNSHSKNIFAIDTVSDFSSPALFMDSKDATFGRDLNVTADLIVGDDLFVIDQVGIGTATPELKLHIGPDAPTGTYLDSVNNNGLLVAPNVLRGMLSVEGNSEGWLTLMAQDGTANQRMAGIEVDGTEWFFRSLNDALGLRQIFMQGQMSTTTGDLILQPAGGNVGIGTATPTYLLEVNGNTSLNKTLFVNTNGRVGIGTSAPNALLDVAGTAIIDDDSSIGRGTVVSGVRLAIQETNTQTTSMLRLIQGSTGDVFMNFVLSAGTDYSMGIDNSDNSNFKIAEGLALAVNTRLTIENSTGDVTIAEDLTVGGTLGTTRQLVFLGTGDATFALTSNVVILTGFAGMNSITTITGGQSGQLLTIIFTDALVTLVNDNGHGSNTLDLTGDITGADDTVIQLVYDGTSWYQVSAPSTN